MILRILLIGLIFIFTLTFFTQSTYILHYIFNDNQEYLIGENYNTSVEDININLTFHENNIDSFYKYHDNEKEDRVFINIFSTNLSENTTLEYRYVYVNNCLYNNFTTAYQTSLVIDKNCLEDKDQQIHINKNSTLAIDRIEIEYFGANENDFQQNYTLIMFIIFILIVLGIAIALTL